MEHPLVIAGGPCAVNPEPMARFIDLFVIGDGEETLPAVCDLWLELKQSGGERESSLAEMAARLPYVYVPRFYRLEEHGDDRPSSVVPIRGDVPTHDRAGGGRRSRCLSAASRAGRALRRMRARSHRHRDHARLSRQDAASAKARRSSGRCGSARSRRSFRRPSISTTTPATTKFRCCRSPPATIRTSTS